MKDVITKMAMEGMQEHYRIGDVEKLFKRAEEIAEHILEKVETWYKETFLDNQPEKEAEETTPIVEDIGIPIIEDSTVNVATTPIEQPEATPIIEPVTVLPEAQPIDATPAVPAPADATPAVPVPADATPAVPASTETAQA
jgi:hypothetical protein